jgi:hypothetical protein
METSKTQYFLKVMSDYYSSGLWDQNDGGAMTELHYFIKNSDEAIALEQELQTWNDKYNETIGWTSDRQNIIFDWENFHKEGILLAKRLKKLMGPNGKVIYFKESNPSTNQSWEEILIED